MKMANVEVPELPEGYVPLEVVAVVKCLDEHGDPTMLVRTSDGLMAWEAVGMLIAASDMARADLQTDMLGIWDDQEDDDEENHRNGFAGG